MLSLDVVDPVFPDDASDMEWGWRLCAVDRMSSHAFRWPVSGWVEAPGPIQKHTGECPTAEGDGICIEYLATNPVKNIYCHDKPKEDIWEDGFIPAMQTVSILFIGGPLLLLGYVAFGNKKIIAEITSRK